MNIVMAIFSMASILWMRYRKRDNSLITIATVIALISVNRTQAQERLASDSTSSVPCEDHGAKMCFSCASEDARADWPNAYEHALARPGNFTQMCDDLKETSHRIHVVACISSCVTLVEPQFVFGKFSFFLQIFGKKIC